MELILREYRESDLPGMLALWNSVVEAGDAFPQLEPMTEAEGRAFFAAQSFTGVAARGEALLGLYILHPNNVGRCGHLANASYAVDAEARGQGVGRQLVLHSLAMAKTLGFRVLQFNAVVCTNAAAIRLYEDLGFVRLGTVPQGFLRQDGGYEDIVLFYKTL